MKKIFKHSLWIIILSVVYHMFNKLLFGKIITPEMINDFGFGKYVFINLMGGAVLYIFVLVVLELFISSRELVRQISKCPFPVKIVHGSDPIGMATAPLQCSKDGCGGFLARPVNSSRDGTAIFCLKCKGEVPVDKFKSFLEHGGKLILE